MDPDPAADTLRERTRRAVQGELIDAAQRLFAEHGFEAVTVDQIAAAAGMSKRSFFRYFTGKDEVILGKVARQGEEFARALAARPSDEPVWTALRRMFDWAVEYGSDPAVGRHAAEMDRLIQSSPTLRAGYLQRMEHAQTQVVEELLRREGQQGAASLPRIAAAAVVAAAFAALLQAHAHAQATGTSFGAALDDAMEAIASTSSAAGA